jgi:hypothetical protein
MKSTFKWYFPPTQNQIKAIWKEGILTVDTNVLLDLYRYHSSTRQALLDSLNGFKGRAWISHQVADEFFRNRNSVILSSTSSFNEAEKNLAEVKRLIEEPVKRLKSSRIIPDEVGIGLETRISEAIEKAGSEISKIRSKFPDYTKNDPILEKICDLFDSSVGPQFDKDAFSEIIKEAKRRKENKIPPGFKDHNKDGDKPYGDYIIWRQILDYVKEIKRPLIFVTSEEKDDWWEKGSGKTLGALYELIKEFHEATGQRFLLYRTARFLEFANENSGKKANKAAVAEIIDVASQREAPAAKVLSQNENTRKNGVVSGELTIELLKPSYKFNISGHFEPELPEVPNLSVNLAKSPPGIPRYSVRSGTGTTFDFHVHLKSMDFGALLPVGKYTFEYNATTDIRHNSIDL